VWAFAVAPAWSGTAAYVIHISVDGLRGDLLQTAMAEDPDGTRAFQRFVAEGATTFDARTDYSYTNTLPNHTCMLTGRPVLQAAGQPVTVHHGYILNSDPGPMQTLHNSGNLAVPYKASTFDVVHDAGLTTGLYASKSKFVLYLQSYDAGHGAPDAVPPDNGTAKVDRYVNQWIGVPETAANMHQTFLTEMLANPVNYAFVHYADLDATGHALGWESAAWRATLRNVDRYLGDVLQLIEHHPQLEGQAVVIVTADHGGTGFNHSNPALPAVYTIPVLVWGAGVARGADLYALNPTTRTHPLDGRPAQTASPPPIRNGDTGNLALVILGLDPIPGSTINAAQDLEVAAPIAVDPATLSKVRLFYR